MLNDDEYDDLPKKCREKRRLMIKRQRLAVVAATSSVGGGSMLFSSSSGLNVMLESSQHGVRSTVQRVDPSL
ncbi:Hypothetical predicted protein, partial [Olea europaea subsp. europaea]